MSNIKSHIKIAVDIPTSDPDNRLTIEPGTNGILVLSDRNGLKLGVDKETLIAAIDELRWMHIKHAIPEAKSEVVEPAVGEILEGDE